MAPYDSSGLSHEARRMKLAQKRMTELKEIGRDHETVEIAIQISKHLLLRTNLPALYRARCLMVVSFDRDFTNTGYSQAKEAVKLLGEDVRALAVSNNANFPQSTLDEAKRLCELAKEFDVFARYRLSKRKNRKSRSIVQHVAADEQEDSLIVQKEQKKETGTPRWFEAIDLWVQDDSNTEPEWEQIVYPIIDEEVGMVIVAYEEETQQENDEKSKARADSALSPNILDPARQAVQETHRSTIDRETDTVIVNDEEEEGGGDEEMKSSTPLLLHTAEFDEKVGSDKKLLKEGIHRSLVDGETGRTIVSDEEEEDEEVKAQAEPEEQKWLKLTPEVGRPFVPSQEKQAWLKLA